MGVGALKGPSLILARSSKCSSVKEAWVVWEVEVMNKIFPLAAQVVIIDFEFYVFNLYSNLLKLFSYKISFYKTNNMAIISSLIEKVNLDLFYILRN